MYGFESIRRFLKIPGCRVNALKKIFGDSSSDNCKVCDRCKDKVNISLSEIDMYESASSSMNNPNYASVEIMSKKRLDNVSGLLPY